MIWQERMIKHQVMNDFEISGCANKSIMHSTITKIYIMNKYLKNNMCRFTTDIVGNCQVVTVMAVKCNPVFFWNIFFIIFRLHCQGCLRQKVLKTSPTIWKDGTTRAYQRYYVHSLVCLRHSSIQKFGKPDRTTHSVISRVLITRNMRGERMFTSQVLRTVVRFARVRYVLLGAAGAGAVGAKMVCICKKCSNKCWILLSYSMLMIHMCCTV